MDIFNVDNTAHVDIYVNVDVVDNVNVNQLPFSFFTEHNFDNIAKANVDKSDYVHVNDFVNVNVDVNFIVIIMLINYLFP